MPAFTGRQQLSASGAKIKAGKRQVMLKQVGVGPIFDQSSVLSPQSSELTRSGFKFSDHVREQGAGPMKKRSIHLSM
jgi:hypothetical protein